jgi:hypothetical protein
MITNNPLSYSKPGKHETSRYEKIHNVIYEDSISASKAVAREIATLIQEKQQKNQIFVLGIRRTNTNAQKGKSKFQKRSHFQFGRILSDGKRQHPKLFLFHA